MNPMNLRFIYSLPCSENVLRFLFLVLNLRTRHSRAKAMELTTLLKNATRKIPVISRNVIDREECLFSFLNIAHLSTGQKCFFHLFSKPACSILEILRNIYSINSEQIEEA